MIIRRLPCLKGMDRSWRTQDIPGRRSLKVGSSVGAGVGRWWRAATGCDPSALIRMALRVGNFGRNGACVAGAAPALPPTAQRYAPPVASPVELSSRLATLRPVLPGQIDCLIAHLSADAETRNPRPDIVWPVGLEWACNKNSADADCNVSWRFVCFWYCTCLVCCCLLCPPNPTWTLVLSWVIMLLGRHMLCYGLVLTKTYPSPTLL